MLQSLFTRQFAYSPTLRVAEVLALLGFLAGLGLLGWNLGTQLGRYTGWEVAVWAISVPFLGYLAADFFSGFVHFLFDSFWSERTPVIGSTFVRSFREHHTDPQSISRHDFVEVNGSNCIAALLVLVPTLIGSDGGTTLGGLWCGGFVFWWLLGISATNQFHKWAHAEYVPRWVQRLQDQGLIISKHHHQLHHTAPFSSYFCITTGWMNPVLERTGFFRAIYWLVRRKPIGSEAVAEG